MRPFSGIGIFFGISKIVCYISRKTLWVIIFSEFFQICIGHWTKTLSAFWLESLEKYCHHCILRVQMNICRKKFWGKSFFIFAWHWEKMLQPIVNNVLAGLSILHSTSPEDHLESFCKRIVCQSVSDNEQKTLVLLLKNFRPEYHTFFCVSRGKFWGTTIFRNKNIFLVIRYRVKYFPSFVETFSAGLQKL